MKLVWSEDFNGPELDKKRWNISSPAGVKVVDGQLSLEITPGSKSMFWRGSKLDTKGKYAVTHAYVEASIQFVQTGGHGCGFSIGNADNKPPAAGMGYENGGGDSVGLALSIVNEERGRSLKPKDNPIPKDDTYSKKFHKFAFWWTPSDYRWYVDGRLVLTMRQPPTPKPMYISFDHSRLPEAGLLKKFPDPSKGPEPMRVDWVKVYQ
jgi:beta-glucanase (GH16 family)